MLMLMLARICHWWMHFVGAPLTELLRSTSQDTRQAASRRWHAHLCCPFTRPNSLCPPLSREQRGQGASDALLDVMGATALRHDLTELDGLDYLSSPRSSIAQAQVCHGRMTARSVR
jgi:hypothetical protein